jgi:hypothetical protein
VVLNLLDRIEMGQILGLGHVEVHGVLRRKQGCQMAPEEVKQGRRETPEEGKDQEQGLVQLEGQGHGAKWLLEMVTPIVLELLHV